MKKELAGILTPAVFTLHWRTDYSPELYSQALVITFHGTCSGRRDGDRSRDAELVPVPLAETITSGPVVLPFSEIDCDRLRAFLEPSEESQAPGQEARFGRAAGRVLAHELYHVLLQTREHGRTGIAKAVHTPAALLSRSLRFEDAELDRIRSRFQKTSFAAN